MKSRNGAQWLALAAQVGASGGLEVGGHLVGRFCRLGAVGGHPIGRFCRRAPAPSAWQPDGNARRSQIVPGGFAADTGLFLNAPQRPTQPPERDHLLALLLAQDIAHIEGG